MDLETAKNYALCSLIFLSKDEKLLKAFLVSSGISLTEIRTQSNNPQFLSCVLDFFLTSDALVLRLSKSLDIFPEQVKLVRFALSNYEFRHWT